MGKTSEFLSKKFLGPYTDTTTPAYIIAKLLKKQTRVQDGHHKQDKTNSQQIIPIMHAIEVAPSCNCTTTSKGPGALASDLPNAGSKMQ